MTNTEFWNNRAVKYGHTGWANYSAYAYDQLARLNAIDNIINELSIKKNSALDFGTGSGDFARLLSRKFESVLAFDISSEVLSIGRSKSAEYSNIYFKLAESVMGLDIKDGSLDIILSVTVLGHLMDGDTLQSHLNFFYKKLSENGRMIALEYMPLKNIKSTEYQRFLTFQQWKNAFSSCHFMLDDCYGFYSPDETPCSSYKLYRKSIVVKLMSVFAGNEWIRKKAIAKAQQIVNNNNDYYWSSQNDDLLKIMVFKKKQ